MKKIISTIALLTLMIFVFIACGKKDGKTGVGLQADKLEKISVGNEKYTMRYKYEKGDKFSYKLSTIVHNQEVVQADSTTTSKVDQNLSYIFDCEVIDVDADNVAELNITVSSINLDASFNGNKITYRSGSKMSAEDKMRFMEYETIYNTPYRARVTPKGEVIEVSRLEKMVDKMNNMSPQKQNLSLEQKTAYAKQLGEQALKPITQMIFREQPEKPIMKDSTWEKRIPQQLGTLSMENIAHFKVLDFVKLGSDKGVKISADLTATFSGKNEGTENGITYNFGQPKVSGDGVIIFNLDSGKLIKADTGTNTVITVTMSGKNSLQKIKKTVRTTTSSNRTKVELL